MNELIDTKKCRLTGDMLHIQFTNGESYVFSLAEIVVECAGGLTPRATDGFWICPNCHITNAAFRSECSECQSTRR